MTIVRLCAPNVSASAPRSCSGGTTFGAIADAITPSKAPKPAITPASANSTAIAGEPASVTAASALAPATSPTWTASSSRRRS